MSKNIMDNRRERDEWREMDLLLSYEQPFRPTNFIVEYIDPDDRFAYCTGSSTLEEALVASDRYAYLNSRIRCTGPLQG